jgi:hypothetical protein
MSFRDATRPQDLGPERLKPAEGTPILSASVEAEGRATDLCTGDSPREIVRARLLAWLAEGAREVTSVLCWLPRQRWAEVPPRDLGELSVIDHVRNIVAHHADLLADVRRAYGQTASASEPQIEGADALVGALTDMRFELLQRFEQAPDEAWEPLEWSLLNTRQHELQHLAAIWKIALNWDRASREPIPGVPLHPADRLEESH